MITIGFALLSVDKWSGLNKILILSSILPLELFEVSVIFNNALSCQGYLASMIT